MEGYRCCCYRFFSAGYCFDNAFKKVDILLTPTCPTTAFLKGDFVNDPLSMYLSDLLTVPANDNIIRLTPPLIITNDEVDQAIEIIHNVIKEIND